MRKKNKPIDPDLKAEIMEAARKPGCLISEVAKSYNISPTLLYFWRSQNNKIQSRTGNNSNFVEALVDKSITQTTCLSKNASHLSPKKASIEFDAFSLELKGSISSDKILQLIKILEQPC